MKKLINISSCIVLGLLITQPLVHASQVCKDTIMQTTPDNHFTIHSDGTVSDNNTGLMWARCSHSLTWDGNSCSGTADTYTWPKALEAAERSKFASYQDWRLPNIKELNSIVELACNYPAINQNIFFEVPNNYDLYYWSSTANPYGYQTYALKVNFMVGGTEGSYSEKYSKSSENYIRLVRNSEPN